MCVCVCVCVCSLYSTSFFPLNVIHVYINTRKFGSFTFAILWLSHNSSSSSPSLGGSWSFIYNFPHTQGDLHGEIKRDHREEFLKHLHLPALSSSPSLYATTTWKSNVSKYTTGVSKQMAQKEYHLTLSWTLTVIPRLFWFRGTTAIPRGWSGSWGTEHCLTFSMACCVTFSKRLYFPPSRPQLHNEEGDQMITWWLLIVVWGIYQVFKYVQFSVGGIEPVMPNGLLEFGRLEKCGLN